MAEIAGPDARPDIVRRGEADAGAGAAAAPSEPRRIAGAGRVGAPIAFQWDGRALTGRRGDTLASALLANGVRIVGRSFKYHRPRGVTSAGVEEAGALVTVGRGAHRTPNVNASVEELTPSLEAFGQNAWPSVSRDVGALTQLGGAGFSAGFYYKTFFSALPWGGRGTRHWMAFEALIRRAAGMGRASRAPDPDAYEHAHLHCDDLVVGSGPAGLEAARTLAEAGRDVVLVEQDFELGGRLLSDRAPIDGASPDEWRVSAIAALEAAGARTMTRTMCFGLYDHGVAGLVERVGAGGVRERMWIARAERIVVAAGAIERPIAFGDNDRPGVMTLGALRTYVNRFGVLPAQRIVVAAGDDGARDSLEELRRAGADVTLLDARPDAPASDAARVVAGAAPLRAHGARGVSGLSLARADGDGWRAEAGRIEAELVAVSGGWQPTTHLLAHRGMKPVWDAERGRFLPAPLSGPDAERLAVCGAAAGLDAPDACAASGRAAAAEILGAPSSDQPTDRPAGRAVLSVSVPGKRAGKAFVDLIHDVTEKDMALAAQEGFVSVEHAKRYTTHGMAVDQGKSGGVLGLAALADARGVDMGSVGVTTFRPPYAPVSIGALAGPRKGAGYKPTRRTPLHDWHARQGAVFTDAGIWKRAWYFPQAGETLDDAYIREADMVRRTVGIADVSTLGKIALSGPDAGVFLDRVFANGFGKLPVGRARYGVMLRDDGVVFDDGTVWRLSETDYLVTTTTAHAGPAMSRLERLWQTRWPELRIALHSVSDAFASLAIAGPEARRVLAAALPDLDVSHAALPFMGVAQTRFGDRPAFVARLSFSGELAFEVYVAADLGESFAAAALEAAEAAGGGLYGLEALGALRIEKGHVAGPEIDGRTTMADLGLGGMASKKKAYVGQALARREALVDPNRPTLVGVEAVDPDAPVSAGAILCATGRVSGHGVGWVSSTTYAPALGRRISLGFIEGGVDAWVGRTAVAADPVRGRETEVSIVWPHFVDPAGDRVRASEAEDGPPLTPPRIAARPRSALGSGVEARVRSGAPGDPVWLEEGPRERHHWLAAETMAAALTCAEVLGAQPPSPGRWSRCGSGALWMRTGPFDCRIAGLDAATARALERTCADDHGVLGVWDMGDGAPRFHVRGAKARDALARLVSVDLRPRAAPVGWVGGVALLGLPAVLAHVEDGFDLWPMRSVAADVWAELTVARDRIAVG